MLAGKPLGRDRKGFPVAFPLGEVADGRPGPELLKEIADRSQGGFNPLAYWNESSLKRITTKLEEAAPSQAVERRQVALWSTLWTFSLILLLLGGEWWLRRHWGLA